MGSVTFYDEMRTTKTVSAAFTELADNATSEYGTDPYSGTVATKYGCVQVTDKVMLLHEAYQYASNLIENEDPRISSKDDPAGAIPVDFSATGDSEFATFTVTLRKGQTVEDVLPASFKKGKVIVTARIQEVVDMVMGKPAVHTPEGRTTTEYVVKRGNSRHVLGTFPTLRDAKEWMVQQASAPSTDMLYYGDNTAYEVHARQKKPGSAALITATPVMKKCVVKVEVEYQKIASRSLRRDGWLFFGWARS